MYTEVQQRIDALTEAKAQLLAEANRRVSGRHKAGQSWAKLSKAGQSWAKLGKAGQSWAKLGKAGQSNSGSSGARANGSGG
jgi:hypothetical protein